MSHLVSLNFGKTPLGKMDSTKVEPIHALRSRCRALWMTTSAIKWKACITKMERVFWAGRNWDMRVRLMVKPLSVYLSFPFVAGVLLFWNRSFLAALTTNVANGQCSHLPMLEQNTGSAQCSHGFHSFTSPGGVEETFPTRAVCRSMQEGRRQGMMAHGSARAQGCFGAWPSSTCR